MNILQSKIRSSPEKKGGEKENSNNSKHKKWLRYIINKQPPYYINFNVNDHLQDGY